MTIKQIIKNIDTYATDDWDLANHILYDMCAKYPSNTDRQPVLAKTFIIGRTYAVALERRRKYKGSDNCIENKLINDDFYVDSVVPIFENLQLDEDIAIINNWGHIDVLALDDGQINHVLELHGTLSVAFTKSTQLNKRSFASKYLHFHLPHIFFIYDSRAYGALKLFFKEIPEAKPKNRISKKGSIDLEYASFYLRCLGVSRYLKTVKPYSDISPRHLDNILIAIANQRL